MDCVSGNERSSLLVAWRGGRFRRKNSSTSGSGHHAYFWHIRGVGAWWLRWWLSGGRAIVMSDWEADDFEVKPVLQPAAVKATWDEEDQESEEEVAAPAAASAPASAHESAVNGSEAESSKPKSRKQLLEEKIKLREAEEARKARDKADALEKELEGLSVAERRARMQEMVEKADLENAKDLFMDAAPDDDEDADPDEPTLDNIALKTSKDDEKFVKLLVEKISPLYHPRRPERYMNVLKSILREGTGELDADDVKDLASTCNVLANEKLKAKSAAQGKKKKTAKKTHIMVDRDDDPLGGPGSGGRGVLGTDYDDFM
ncbi:Eukaryotic translation initiation factor 3 subunit J [Porphyridium purpureum]|uniref:Eukaryotic translation initiation factor 3 subunit J n=1 Tax=Porphyridium purpureum TaxID=35688 RepID=A0A5J4Z7B4_PORPP|nr:Eukaryotic translation initiation factor 3 subunit J [Porphyridium purpureum]|eukprot:POR0542..scf295_1